MFFYIFVNKNILKKKDNFFTIKHFKGSNKISKLESTIIITDASGVIATAAGADSQVNRWAEKYFKIKNFSRRNVFPARYKMTKFAKQIYVLQII